MLDYISCSGSEARLSDCRSSTYNSRYCNRDNEAGVTCQMATSSKLQLNSFSSQHRNPGIQYSWLDMYLILYQIVVMVISDWWEVDILWKAVWRCAMMGYGEQCVVISGTTLMLLWSVECFIMSLQVSL